MYEDRILGEWDGREIPEPGPRKLSKEEYAKLKAERDELIKKTLAMIKNNE